MTLIRKVTNKWVLGAILALILVFTPNINAKALQPQANPSNNIVYNSNKRVIGIKNNYKGTKMTVRATAYTNDPITSTGTKPTEGRTIAVDPKVIPYGTKVYIPQFNKVFIAEDCGSAIKGNRIDIYMNSYKACMDWGIQTIDIIILD